MVEAKKMVTIKNNYTNSLSYYLTEISKIPLLTREEEENLALRAKGGEVFAREKLINSNLRFVVAVAKKYRNQGIPLSDLINEGNLGLLTAIEKFDHTLGFHFISYAVWWIRQAILKSICEKSRMIRLPLNRANELIQIERMRKKIETETENDAKPEDIANELNMNVKLVRHLMDISKETISLETPIFENKDSSNLSEFIRDDKYFTPEQVVETDSLSGIITSVLETLSEKEKDIIENRFGLNGTTTMSLKEIGVKYNLTKERIRQIEKKALTRLRHSSRSGKLENYVNA